MEAIDNLNILYPIKKGLVTISCHKLSKDVPKNTLKSILKQAQLKEEDL